MDWLQRLDDYHAAVQARNIICKRCSENTGNQSQGHYWNWCTDKMTMRALHFCCPSGCELKEVE